MPHVNPLASSDPDLVEKMGTMYLKNTGRIQITKAQALQVQAEQIAHYSAWDPKLAEKAAALTTADQLEDDVLYDIAIINKHIPRGVALEIIVFGKPIDQGRD